MKNTYKYKILTLFVTLILTLTATACTDIDSETVIEPETSITEAEHVAYPVEAGPLEFFEAPKTVASLSPAVTEIICELGFGDKLIGRSVYCDYPTDISTLAEIGSAANPDIEEILTLKPELLISQSPIAKKDITRLEAVGIRVLIISAPNSVDELYNVYRDIAAVFGGDLVADQLAETAMSPLYNELDKVANPKESYLLILTSDLNVASADTFMGDIISHFGENKANTLNLTVDEILENPPSTLLLAEPLTVEMLPEELRELNAVVNGSVISLDITSLERPTAKVYQSIPILNSKIIGEENSDSNIEDNSTENIDENNHKIGDDTDE